MGGQVAHHQRLQVGMDQGGGVDAVRKVAVHAQVDHVGQVLDDGQDAREALDLLLRHDGQAGQV